MASLLQKGTRCLTGLPLRLRPLLLYRTLMTLPSFSLEGKTCVVTGAGRGLGKEFLAAFALSGAKGACVDLSLKSGEASIKEISERVTTAPPASKAEGHVPELRAYACDVTSESEVQATWASILSDFGKIDVVLTAAGIVDNVAAEEYAYDRWRKMFDINLHGSFLFAREAGKYWIKEKIRGNLILVSSMSSMICVRPQKQAAYNAVSALLHHCYSLSLALHDRAFAVRLGDAE
jgi:sorbose reductase